jgi:hypothetical protein
VISEQFRADREYCSLTVMAGLVPAIHVFLFEMPSPPARPPVGTKGVDARHKAEHDGL